MEKNGARSGAPFFFSWKSIGGAGPGPAGEASAAGGFRVKAAQRRSFLRLALGGAPFSSGWASSQARRWALVCWRCAVSLRCSRSSWMAENKSQPKNRKIRYKVPRIRFALFESFARPRQLAIEFRCRYEPQRPLSPKTWHLDLHQCSVGKLNDPVRGDKSRGSRNRLPSQERY